MGRIKLAVSSILFVTFVIIAPGYADEPAGPESTPIAKSEAANKSESKPQTSPAGPCICPAPDAKDDPGEAGFYEVTAATELGYPARHIFRYGQRVHMVSTTSGLFMAEYGILPRVRLAISYDLMMTTERLFVDDVPVETVLPSRIAAGVTLVPVRFNFSKAARFEGQVLGFGGLTMEAHPEFVPIAMGRLHVMPNRHRGVGIYLGSSYHFRIDKASLLFGVGYRF